MGNKIFIWLNDTHEVDSESTNWKASTIGSGKLWLNCGADSWWFMWYAANSDCVAGGSWPANSWWCSCPPPSRSWRRAQKGPTGRRCWRRAETWNLHRHYFSGASQTCFLRPQAANQVTASRIKVANHAHHHDQHSHHHHQHHHHHIHNRLT